MYAQVVVLTYQSPDTDSYTYEIPKNLEKEIKVGQLVEVPFGKRNPLGVVLSHESHPHPSVIPAKAGIGVNSSEDQILNQAFGSETQARRVEDDTKKIVIKEISSVVFTQPLLLPYQIKLLKWISEYYLAPMVNCLEVMLPVAALKAKRLRVNAEKFQNSISRSSLDLRQSLILVPTINQIPETLAKFPKAKNYALYHNELKNSEKFSTWLKILSGKCDYIFGSRSAIFTPSPNLKEIIIYDEHNSAHKDERSPYFDTLTVAQKISEVTGAQIKIVDPSPKITTYFQLKNHIKMQKFDTQTKIINMADEKLRGNFSPISTFLQTQLYKNQNALLLLNKKKESGSMYCKSCKFNDYFEKQPESCPKCKSQDIYFNVLNIDSLRIEVKKNTKRSAFSVQRSEIDVQTATVFYSPKIKKYNLAAYIQPDPLLNRADFASPEILFSQIISLKKLLKDSGTLIIQTYNPDDETIKAAALNDYQKFYAHQIEMCRSLSYPPFSLLIKITVRGKNREKVEKLAHATFSFLNSTIEQFSPLRSETSDLAINLLGPFEPVFFSKIVKFNIIIKYRLGSYNLAEREKAIQKLSPILKEVDKNVQITVDPASLN